MPMNNYQTIIKYAYVNNNKKTKKKKQWHQSLIKELLLSQNLYVSIVIDLIESPSEVIKIYSFI